MDTYGFYGDTFSNGFGKFYTSKRFPRMMPGLPKDYFLVEDDVEDQHLD